MSAAQLVLAVGLPAEVATKLAPALGRTEFEVNTAESFEHGARLVPRVRFDAVLAGTDGDEGALDELLGAVRRPGSLSAAASVLLFLPREEMPLSRAYVSAGATQVVSSALAAADLQGIVLRALRAKVRVSLRVIARLTVKLDGSASHLLCQTSDLSRNGMFVVTDTRFPIGSPVQFTLELSRSGDSVRGEAEVVRYSHAGKDHSEGLGLRFVRFAADGESRLAAFLEHERS